MSYRNTVKNNVNLAFNLIGDLAIDVTFTPHDITGFDFSAKDASETPSVPASKTIKAVFLEQKKKSKTKNTKQLQLLFKTEDLPNVTAYDTVTVRGVVYRVGKPIEDNDYVVYVEIFSGG